MSISFRRQSKLLSYHIYNHLLVSSPSPPLPMVVDAWSAVRWPAKPHAAERTSRVVNAAPLPLFRHSHALTHSLALTSSDTNRQEGKPADSSFYTPPLSMVLTDIKELASGFEGSARAQTASAPTPPLTSRHDAMQATPVRLRARTHTRIRSSSSLLPPLSAARRRSRSTFTSRTRSMTCVRSRATRSTPSSPSRSAPSSARATTSTSTPTC